MADREADFYDPFAAPRRPGSHLEIAPPSTHPRRESLPHPRRTAVLAEEEGPPAGQEPMSWWLLTTLPIATPAEAERAVRWRAPRWPVERSHDVLKGGRRVERLQSETAERLDRALATHAVVAWRLPWLTSGARRHPEASCEAVLPREQWQESHRVAHKTDVVPAPPPGLREAVRQVARLGGFLARKGDGEPGPRRSVAGCDGLRTS